MLYSKLLITLFLSVNLYAQHFAVVVSKSSKINSIETHELSRIFLAKTRTFPNGQKAIVIESTNKEYQEFFYKKVTNKNKRQLKKYWAKMIFTGRGQPAIKFDSIEEIINFVKSNKNAISYIPYRYINNNIKVIMEIK